MRPSYISILSTLSATLTLVSAQWPVPVPWTITDFSMANVRHGTGGFWQFDIADTPTLSPQGFNTQTCYYYGETSYYFGLDDYPVDVPCNENFTELTFTVAPNGNLFDFNITHLWGPAHDGNDNGTWTFSSDDVRGQEDDVGNNFGQAGAFSRSEIQMYPLRSTPSTEIYD